MITIKDKVPQSNREVVKDIIFTDIYEANIKENHVD